MERVHIENTALLQQKISCIRSAGPGALHIVADFDRTLTKAFSADKKNMTSFEQLRQGDYLGEEFTLKSQELFKKYYPIERSDKVSDKEKNTAMLEWWTRHLEQTIHHGLTREMLENIAKKGGIKPREHLFEILCILSKQNIPLLVFSAGLGDVITEFFRYNKVLTANMHILANFYTFKDNKVTGFRSGIIHSANKNEIAIKETPFFRDISERKNVILLGDSLEDLKMAQGLEHECIIRIGFLNEEVEKDLGAFSRSYDVVITGDGGMGYIKSLIEKILQ